MSRFMCGMVSELIGGTLKPKYHSDSAGRREVMWNRKQNRNIAFERCIEVMSRLIMKYGPGLLEKMDQEKLKDLISAEIESGADKDRFSSRMLGYCKLMTDRE